MRVLDIDLDAFVVPTATLGAPTSQRLPATEFTPWHPDDIAAFLESSCRLSLEAPRPGAVFEHHQEAFFYWKRLIAAGRLAVPFDVVHVDAHSDISSEGSGGHIYVLTELLSYALREREPHLDESRVRFANYPVFAAALGWMRTFTWVRPPTGDDGVSAYYCGDAAIQLRRYPSDAFTGLRDWRHITPLAEDPPIPASIVTTDDYRSSQPFDFVTLCRSPGFTPASADESFELIRRYIDETGG